MYLHQYNRTAVAAYGGAWSTSSHFQLPEQGYLNHAYHSPLISHNVSGNFQFQYSSNFSIGSYLNQENTMSNFRHNQEDETLILDEVEQDIYRITDLYQQVETFYQEDETFILDGGFVRYTGNSTILPEVETGVGGLSEEFISSNLKTRNCCSEDDNDFADQICVVCQDGLCNETIGILVCGHEYHVLCIKEWLKQKNICPLCKSTGLTIG